MVGEKKTKRGSWYFPAKEHLLCETTTGVPLHDGDLGGRDEKLYENFGGPTHLSLEHKCFGGNRRHMSSHETNMHALIYFKGNKFVLQGK